MTADTSCVLAATGPSDHTTLALWALVALLAIGTGLALFLRGRRSVRGGAATLGALALIGVLTLSPAAAPSAHADVCGTDAPAAVCGEGSTPACPPEEPPAACATGLDLDAFAPAMSSYREWIDGFTPEWYEQAMERDARFTVDFTSSTSIDFSFAVWDFELEDWIMTGPVTWTGTTGGTSSSAVYDDGVLWFADMSFDPRMWPDDEEWAALLVEAGIDGEYEWYEQGESIVVESLTLTVTADVCGERSSHVYDVTLPQPQVVD